MNTSPIGCTLLCQSWGGWDLGGSFSSMLYHSFLGNIPLSTSIQYNENAMRTSYSAIETYLQCPQKYKFQEIDRIRVPKSREAIFGTLVHNTLKYMFQRDPLFPTLEEVVSYFREHWPAHEIFEQESKHDLLKRGWTEEEQKVYFDEGIRMLKAFYERNAPWNFTVVDLESRFEVLMEDSKTGETHVLAGIIDRIDKLPGGTYEIIDYKTAKRMPSQAALDKNLQLSLYSLGLQKRWPHLAIDEIKTSLYFLKHSEKLTSRITSDVVEKTKTHVLKTIADIQDRIHSGKEFEPMPSALCDWCGYRPICPAWRHLYRKNDKVQMSNDKFDEVIREYFELKKSTQQNETRMAELQSAIKAYMENQGLTRVFGEDGVISKKLQQRYNYDYEKIKAILSPLGKWEEILKADETRLKRIMSEVPVEIREAIEGARSVAKEYTVMTASLKKVKMPEEGIEES